MDLILNKLQKQLAILEAPIIACIDFDGTIYTAGKTMWKAPYYNQKTSRILHEQSIPFVLITGRADWKAVDEVELQVLGMPKPDVVVTGAGSMVYYRQTNGNLMKDEKRLEILQKSLFLWKDAKGITHEETWNKKRIIDIARTYHEINYLALSKDDDNIFVVRFTVRDMSIDLLEKIKTELKELFPAGIKILIAEKLLQKNTLHIFSGDILVVPARAGKDSAVAYLLEKLTLSSPSQLHAYLFGDSSIDIKMLAMPENQNRYILSQYGVHLTPRANRILHKVAEKNPHLQLREEEGPNVIYHVFKQVFSHFSPARNNYLRYIIRPFEQVINKTIYPKLTANELSFKGLSLVMKGIDITYDPKTNVYQKARGLHYYLLGMSLDAADGIRARNNVVQEEHGQLVDVFCDRAKEFYQLYKRAQTLLSLNSPLPAGRETKGEEENYEVLYNTFLTTLSCILPSIARAQAEIENIVVKEQDEKGGSMLERSKRLFSSLIYDMRGNHKKSSVIDQEIYKTNIATYENRLSTLNSPPKFSPSPALLASAPKKRKIKHIRSAEMQLFSSPVGEELKERRKTLKSVMKNVSSPTSIEVLTDLQKKALERFLLLVQLLQEENKIISDKLKDYLAYSEKYQIEFQPKIVEYLKIDVKATRKKLQIQDPYLSLKSFLK